MTTQASDTTQYQRMLKLNYSGRIIDHLGIQMYQSPVAAISELVANAWDADANRVSIDLPTAIAKDAEIVISDDGNGMAFNECQDRFLNVGYARRGNRDVERSPSKNRRILGRKGIGKFAGFGIARVIQVETISEQNGEKTVFEMDIDKLRSDDYVNIHIHGTDIAVADYAGPDDARRKQHGTTIRLQQLSMQRTRSPKAFARSMARRFLLHQLATDFQILVNGASLPESDDRFSVQFSFPSDYRDSERPPIADLINEWGTEVVGDHEIGWRIRFYENPIADEDLRGISVFAGVKMVQAPFFFNLSGSLPGQHGQQYISGQIQANFIDEQDDDLIAPERQRVNWDHPAVADLQDWGRQRLRQLLTIWRDRRGEHRQHQLAERLSTFSNRLENLPPHERRTVVQAVRRLAQIETLSDDQFEELGTAMLTAWEQGRLHEITHSIADADEMTADQLVKLLTEAEVLTALNMAEAVKTKLQTVGGLKQRIEKRDLENAVRDYISLHPWLISPKWESFAVERNLNNLLKSASIDSGIAAQDDFKCRFDLALSGDEHLLILEFMRPGLTLDWDHVDRFERYVRIVSENVAANTGSTFHKVTGYIVADKLHTRSRLPGRLQALARDDMYALDWPTLLAEAAAQWQDFLDILAGRDPQDERLKYCLPAGTDNAPQPVLAPAMPLLPLPQR